MGKFIPWLLLIGAVSYIIYQRSMIMTLTDQVVRTEGEAAELEALNQQLTATLGEKNATIAERDALIEELRNSQADPELVARLEAANNRLDAANARQVEILTGTPPDGGGEEG